MEYRRLGASGVRVSEIGLGSWLTYGGGVEADQAKACVVRAYELGVNFFDTADVYGRGAAEEVMGQALTPFPRSSYVLATKVYFPVGDGPNDRGLSRKHIMEQCAASLRRLGTDYLDLYQCHRYDDETPPEETLRALDDLVRQGKVHYVGVREWVGQVVWSPLAQGVLTGKYRRGQAPPADSRAASRKMGAFVGRFLTDEVLEAVEGVRVVANEAGLSMAQLALAWVLRDQTVASAIVGASRPEQLDDNCAAAGRRLDAEVLAAVDKAVAG